MDVVYIGTIADHHYEWTKESILAGKATVVEKPMTLTYDSTRELIQLANARNVFLMEGMWTRCFPAMHKLRQLLSSKNENIGDVIYCQGDFGWAFPTTYTKEDRIWLADSGGVTLDIGMYIAQLGQIAFPNCTVKNVQATGTVKNGVDYTVMATITYDRSTNSNDSSSSSSSRVGDGMLQMAITGAANTEERCIIQGTKGRIILDGPFHVPQRLRVQYDTGRDSDSSNNKKNEVIYDYPLPTDPYNGVWNNPGSIGFVHQINEVGIAIRDGQLQCNSFTWEDSLEVAKVVDEIVYQVRGEREIVKKQQQQRCQQEEDGNDDTDSDGDWEEDAQHSNIRLG